MKFEREIVGQVKGISWFHNVGKPINTEVIFPIQYVEDWRQAKRFYSNPAWSDYVLEARNTLTSFLHREYREEYRKWNEMSVELGDFFDESILPTIEAYREKHGLDKSFIDCVSWDVFCALMEDAYSSCDGRPVFFLELLKIYESGNFPCGWDGKNGRLIVF